MERYIQKVYHNKLISRLFHTSVYCLQRELKSWYSVLDLGCGPDSPVQYCNISYGVGVDAFRPYIKASKRGKIHAEHILSNISSLNLRSGSFDAVVLIEVLEHLDKKDGELLLQKMEAWGREKIIISCPNGYLPQASMSQNPFQVHRSGWSVDEMKRRGYKAYGMSGLRSLRKENTSLKMEDTKAIYSTIKFRPKIFWLIISELTQAIAYYFPELSFEVFYVKTKSSRKLKG